MSQTYYVCIECGAKTRGTLCRPCFCKWQKEDMKTERYRQTLRLCKLGKPRRDKRNPVAWSFYSMNKAYDKKAHAQMA